MHLEGTKALFEAQNTGLCTANQLCVSLHISATATGNARLCVAAVVRAALRHERIFPRVCAIRSESCGTGVPELWAAAIRRLGMRVTIPMRRGETVSLLSGSLESDYRAVMGMTLRSWNMPDPRLMCDVGVQSRQ